jgi:cysteinyl-tRNA synthetase
LTQRLRLAEDSVIIEQQRATTVLNTYKRNLEKTEKKLAESRKEVASLNAQMRQLYNNKKEDKTDDSEKEYKENQKNIQEDLLKILVEQVKSSVVPVRPASRPHTPVNENVIKKLTLDNENLYSELHRAKEYIDRLESDGNNALLSKV